MLLNSMIYALLPTLKKRGDWSLVLQTYAGMMFLSGVSNGAYYILEAMNPLKIRSRIDPQRLVTTKDYMEPSWDRIGD